MPVEEHVLIMAPPRTGKTGLLAKIILHYPGPVVSTTTKHDVFELTSGIRSRLGPVHVFNPQRIGGVPSTFRWNPVDGCDDEAVGDPPGRRLRQRGQHDRHRGRLVLDAARPAATCAACSTPPPSPAATCGWSPRWALGSAEDAEDILAQAGAAQWALELAELRGEAQKTARRSRWCCRRALAFMTDPALAQSVLPDRATAASTSRRSCASPGRCT